MVLIVSLGVLKTKNNITTKNMKNMLSEVSP